MMSRPLEGVRVVEAASYLSGPLAAMVLADLGATVTKVEPLRGDPYRRFGALYGDASLEFRAVNQNKTSVGLDLSTEEGQHALDEMLVDADVFITNWRPGVAERLGLDAAEVRTRHPRLIWVRVSGWGQDGPRAKAPAFDSIVYARSGAALSSVVAGEPPNVPNQIIADKVSALMAAQTASAALIERARTGEGAICDMAMTDALSYFFAADIAAGHRAPDIEPDLRVGGRFAAKDTFATLDGWITISPVSGAQLRSALGAFGMADRWAEVKGDDPTTLYDRFMALIAPELGSRRTAELEAMFDEADVPATAVLDFAAHMADEQIVHNGTHRVVEDRDLGRYVQVQWPGIFNGQRAQTDGLASPAHPESAAE